MHAPPVPTEAPKRGWPGSPAPAWTPPLLVVTVTVGSAGAAAASAGAARTKEAPTVAAVASRDVVKRDTGTPHGWWSASRSLFAAAGDLPARSAKRARAAARAPAS